MAVLLAAALGGGFSGLEVAEYQTQPGDIGVEVTVQLTGSEGPVIGHFLGPTGQEERVAFALRHPGSWAGTISLREANWVLVLEDVGEGELSQGVDFATLGLVGPAGVARSRPQPEPGPPWGWLSLACLAGAMSLLLLGLGRTHRPRHLRL